MKRSYTTACSLAGLLRPGSPKSAPLVRLHDLRHSYASLLVSQGMSLPTIGALLGHTQTQTTARYAHLLDDVLREATELVGKLGVKT